MTLLLNFIEVFAIDLTQTFPITVYSVQKKLVDFSLLFNVLYIPIKSRLLYSRWDIHTKYFIS